MHSRPDGRLRILAAVETWEGSTSWSFVNAFKELGHAVQVIPQENFSPSGWRSPLLRAARRVADPLIAREMTVAITASAARFRPDLFFTMKGVYVTLAALAAVHRAGGVAINFWPDTGIMGHGRRAAASLPSYDWVFTAKSFGVESIKRSLGKDNVALLPHGFDHDIHRPIALDEYDRERFGCDVVFVGTWSPKKQLALETLVTGIPGIDLKIWGNRWEGIGLPLSRYCSFRAAEADDYCKAILGAKIALGLLFEGDRDAPSGDLTTTRTYEIPAIGAFMLHERTADVEALFEPGQECATFSDPVEMIHQVRRYLADDVMRTRIAAAGHLRCINSGHSIQDRAADVIAMARRLKLGSSNIQL